MIFFSLLKATGAAVGTGAAEATGFWTGIPAGAWTLAGAVVGSIGLKLLETWLTRNNRKRDDRKEFRGEIQRLQDRLDQVEEEVTFWRNRFYEEQEVAETLRILMIKSGLTPPPRSVKAPEKNT